MHLLVHLRSKSLSGIYTILKLDHILAIHGYISKLQLARKSLDSYGHNSTPPASPGVSARAACIRPPWKRAQPGSIQELTVFGGPICFLKKLLIYDFGDSELAF